MEIILNRLLRGFEWPYKRNRKSRHVGSTKGTHGWVPWPTLRLSWDEITRASQSRFPMEGGTRWPKLPAKYIISSKCLEDALKNVCTFIWTILSSIIHILYTFSSFFHKYKCLIQFDFCIDFWKTKCLRAFARPSRMLATALLVTFLSKQVIAGLKCWLNFVWSHSCWDRV